MEQKFSSAIELLGYTKALMALPTMRVFIACVS